MTNFDIFKEIRHIGMFTHSYFMICIIYCPTYVIFFPSSPARLFPSPQSPRNMKHVRGLIARESRCYFACSTTMTIEDAKRVWKSSDAVCFDVDSTVITDEGIDELATFCGRGKEVSAW